MLFYSKFHYKRPLLQFTAIANHTKKQSRSNKIFIVIICITDTKKYDYYY